MKAIELNHVSFVVKHSHKNGLRIHIQFVHKGEKNHICETCGLACQTNAQLQMHIKRVHEGKKDYPCNICGNFFKDKMNVKRHIEGVHEGVKHKCDICGNEFSHKSGVVTHKMFVHKIPAKKEQQKHLSKKKISMKL